MRISDVSVPEIYKKSADFRFFLTWFEDCLSRIKYDTENIHDLYDPQRCPSQLVWMLADTMGFKFDDRLPTAFNRLVLIYFMSMIRYKGSKNGVTLAAEVNLAQFNINEYGKEKDILYDRLEDTSIPVNSVYVTPHTADGYIDVVYFSSEKPVDACIEYVRPLGMYCFQHAGVRVDSKTKVSVDARLTNTNDLHVSIGPTRVGNYSREDYARLQKSRQEISDNGKMTKDTINYEHNRQYVYRRNSDAEGQPDARISPGYRSLYSLQLCNNTHIVKSLIPVKDVGDSDATTPTEEREQIFSLGYGPQDVSTHYPDSYLKEKDYPEYNLRYDRKAEYDITTDVYSVESGRTGDILTPRPAVNPIMTKVGDAISLNATNTEYTKATDKEIEKVTE